VGDVGYVPQDDLIHRDLPVITTLRYAARLRLPPGTPAAQVEAAVARTVEQLGLAEQAAQPVHRLSGGQRKRVSIAVELLRSPPALFLDEPTSGLDPATAAALLRTLLALARAGTTVVLTTHSPDDLRSCDVVVVVAGGTARRVGTPAEVRREYGIDHLSELYERLPRGTTALAPPDHEAPAARRVRPARTSCARCGWHRWRVLAARNASILRRNRLTLAVMLLAPALVIAMFAVLFRPGALDAGAPDAGAAVSTTYWMAFAAFFFGLTYGLLQVCTELAIVRREAFVGVGIVPYLAGKAVVLIPVLAGADVLMLAVLRTLDRLPPLSGVSLGRMAVTLLLTSVAALALGILASAAVADPAQATLALPMLCFPAVLFAGAVVPVASMNGAGRLVSVAVLARWSFESLGRDLGLTAVLAHDPTGAGPALLRDYGGVFDGGSAGRWAVLAAFGVAFFVVAGALLRVRTRPR
jgi:ABC-2 type transporter/ABC transporter